jgi:hypothetical protein
MDCQNRNKTDKKRIAGRIIAAAVSAMVVTWLVTGWLHYSTLSEPPNQPDARSISAPSAPMATICMFADSSRRYVPTPIATCPGRQWG